MVKGLKERPFLPECMGSYQKTLYLLSKGKKVRKNSNHKQKWMRCPKKNNDLVEK